MITWEKQMSKEVGWWLTHGKLHLAIQCHCDFFEHIFVLYCRSLASRNFEQALEIGPGASGGYLSIMPNIGKRVALDPICDDLRKHNFLPFDSGNKIKYVNGLAEDMPFGDNSFDLIIISNALDHVKDMDKTMSEMKRVLKTGGHVLFFTFLNVKNPHPHTFRTVPDAMAMFKDFDLVECHAITKTREFTYLGARNPYYVGVYKYEGTDKV